MVKISTKCKGLVIASVFSLLQIYDYFTDLLLTAQWLRGLTTDVYELKIFNNPIESCLAVYNDQLRVYGVILFVASTFGFIQGMRYITREYDSKIQQSIALNAATNMKIASNRLGSITHSPTTTEMSFQPQNSIPMTPIALRGNNNKNSNNIMFENVINTETGNDKKKCCNSLRRMDLKLQKLVFEDLISLVLTIMVPLMLSIPVSEASILSLTTSMVFLCFGYMRYAIKKKKQLLYSKTPSISNMYKKKLMKHKCYSNGIPCLILSLVITFFLGSLFTGGGAIYDENFSILLGLLCFLVCLVILFSVIYKCCIHCNQNDINDINDINSIKYSKFNVNFNVCHTPRAACNCCCVLFLCMFYLSSIQLLLLGPEGTLFGGSIEHIRVLSTEDDCALQFHQDEVGWWGTSNDDSYHELKLKNHEILDCVVDGSDNEENVYCFIDNYVNDTFINDTQYFGNYTTENEIYLSVDTCGSIEYAMFNGSEEVCYYNIQYLLNDLKLINIQQ